MNFFVAYYLQLGCGIRKACKLARERLSEAGLLEQPLLPEMISPSGSAVAGLQERDEAKSPFD